jgi:hypothetical protein
MGLEITLVRIAMDTFAIRLPEVNAFLPSNKQIYLL